MEYPKSIEAEQGVLGSILLKPKMLNAVSLIIRPDDFYEPRHKLIYNAMLKLSTDKKAIDCLTVAEFLKDCDVSAVYVSDLSSGVPTAMHATAYADTVKEKAVEREYLITLSIPETPEITLEKLNALVRRKSDTAQDKTEMIYENTAEKLEQRIAVGNIKPMRTNHGHLNALLGGGFIRGCYYIFSGGTGTGKTRLAMDWVVDLVGNGFNVFYVSLEMALSAIEAMYVAKKYGVDYNRFNTGNMEVEKMEDIYKALEVEKENFAIRQHVKSKEPMTPDMLEFEIEEQLKVRPVDFVIVDYVTLMYLSGFGKASYETAKMYGAISRRLNEVAIKYNVAVIGLVQTARRKRGEEGFEIGDVSQSFEMLHPAHVVAGILRTKTSGEVNIQFTKNRFGGQDLIKGNMDWSKNTWNETSGPDFAVEKHKTDKEDDQPF